MPTNVMVYPTDYNLIHGTILNSHEYRCNAMGGQL